MTNSFQAFKAKEIDLGSCAPALERQDTFHHVLSMHFFSRAQHCMLTDSVTARGRVTPRVGAWNIAPYDSQGHEL